MCGSAGGRRSPGDVWTRSIRGLALSGDSHLVAGGSVNGTIRLWEAGSGAHLGTLRGERRYERLDIAGQTGVTGGRRAALLALGALDRAAVAHAS